jgi:hypothetical protein
LAFSIVEDPAPNQVFVVVSGEVSMQEMMNFIATHRGGDERQFAFLFDVSDADVAISGEQVRQVAVFAAREARKGPMGPVAFISSNPGPFGMTRMYQAYSSAEGRRNVGVFHTLTEAQHWLGKLGNSHA